MFKALLFTVSLKSTELPGNWGFLKVRNITSYDENKHCIHA